MTTDRTLPIVSTVRGIFVGLGVFVLVAIVAIALYLGGWWLKKDVFNRQASVNRHSFEQQTTYRDEMIRKISDVRDMDVQIAAGSTPQLIAQRKAIVDIVCRDNTHISGGLDDSTASFVSQECPK